MVYFYLKIRVSGRVGYRKDTLTKSILPFTSLMRLPKLEDGSICDLRSIVAHILAAAPCPLAIASIAGPAWPNALAPARTLKKTVITSPPVKSCEIS